MNRVELPPLRFITQEQLSHGCEVFRLSAVGYTRWKPSRYERIYDAATAVRARWPEVGHTAAYKDLETNLNWGR